MDETRKRFWLRVAGVMVVVMLLAGGIVSMVPNAAAQGPAPDPSAPATAGDVAEVNSKIDALQASQLAYQQNTTQFLVQLTHLLTTQNQAMGSFNATVAGRLDSVSVALATQSVHALNQTQQVALIAALMENVLQSQNATVATLSTTNATVAAATQAISLARAEMLSGLAHFGQRLTELDRNMTGDHVKLYSGSYITDPADPNVGKPAYVAVLAASRALADNQVVAHNDSVHQHNALQHNMNGGFAGVQNKEAEVAAKVDTAIKKANTNKWLILAVLGIIAGLLVYVFGPRVRYTVAAQRAGAYRTDEDDARAEQEAELEEMRAQARQRQHAPAAAPAPAAEPAARDGAPAAAAVRVVATRPRRRSFAAPGDDAGGV